MYVVLILKQCSHLLKTICWQQTDAIQCGMSVRVNAACVPRILTNMPPAAGSCLPMSVVARS